MKIFLATAISFCIAGTLSAAVITNGGFETPALSPGTYSYDPTGATWLFTGNSGIASNGSGFGFTSDGSNQVAFLQTGTASNLFSETITSVSVGDVISFSDALRTSGQLGDTYVVSYNGTTLGTFTPTSTSWTSHSVTIGAGAPATGVLAFTGLNTAGVDLDTGIDNITAGTPEPVSLLLLGSGLLLFSLKTRKRFR